ncbi:hypothetical protein PMAYCL1PPCAC_15550, partial [Pristionchus mayeri]
AIEYVKMFNFTFGLNFSTEDQVAAMQSSVIQLSLLEMIHFSYSAGFDHLTFPDGTRKQENSNAYTISHTIRTKVGDLSLSRSELALLKGLIVCKA